MSLQTLVGARKLEDERVGLLNDIPLLHNKVKNMKHCYCGKPCYKCAFDKRLNDMKMRLIYINSQLKG